MSLFNRVLNSPTMMSWASYFVRFGSALFVLPLLLKIYSPIEQSFWFFANTLIVFAMLADSGFGATLIRAVSYFKAGADYIPRTKQEYDDFEGKKEGEPNLEKLKNLLTTSNRIYIYLGLFTIILLSTGGIAAAWNILELSGHRLDIWIAYILIIPTSYTMVVAVKWSSFMRGLGYITMEARAGVVFGVIRVLAFIVLLTFKLGPAYLIAGILLESVAKYYYFKWFVNRWFKKQEVRIKDDKYFDKEIFRSLWGATWRTGLLFWGAYGVQQGTSILASQLNDAVVMANFLLTMRIVSFVLNIARAPFYTNVPKIYHLAAEKNLKTLRKKSSEYMFLGIGVMVAAFLVIGGLGNTVLDLFGIDTRFVGTTIFLIIAVTEILDLHSSFHATIYTSTNHIPFVLPSTISGALILIIGFQVLPEYGVLGIVATKFIVQFMFNNWYAWILSLKLLKWPFFSYIKQFPYYGVQFIRSIIKQNILKRV